MIHEASLVCILFFLLVGAAENSTGILRPLRAPMEASPCHDKLVGESSAPAPVALCLPRPSVAKSIATRLQLALMSPILIEFGPTLRHPPVPALARAWPIGSTLQIRLCTWLT